MQKNMSKSFNCYYIVAHLEDEEESSGTFSRWATVLQQLEELTRKF